jgi:hypothetical protein
MRLPRPNLKIKIVLPISLVGFCKGLKGNEQQKKNP